MSNGPCSCFKLFQRLEHMDVAETLAFQPAQGTMQLLRLPADDVRAEITVGARLAAVMRHTIRHVQYDGYGQTMKLSGDFHERFARFWLNIRSVRDRQLSSREPFAGNEMKHFKSILRRRLAVLVIRHQPATIIGGQNPIGLKCFRANVLLPEPDTPISTTKEISGMVRVMRADGDKHDQVWMTSTIPASRA